MKRIFIIFALAAGIAIGVHHIKEPEAIMVADPDHPLVLVNKINELNKTYQPVDMREVSVPFSPEGDESRKLLRSKAANALEELFEAAGSNNYRLTATSGFRSYDTQRKLYEEFVNNLGVDEAKRICALPGQSEHQTGLAMDITSPSYRADLHKDFGETEEGKWVARHSHEFGFIIRYPEGGEDITGYRYEPWHLRYVGVDAATAIYENNLTLEEFLGVAEEVKPVNYVKEFVNILKDLIRA